MASEEIQQASVVENSDEPLAAKPTQSRKRIVKKHINKILLKGDGETKKPPEYKILQQKMPACRPVYTAYHVAALFLFIGVLFLILGAVFLDMNLKLHEFSVPYTSCNITSDCNQTANFSTCEEYLSSLVNISNVERNDSCSCYCELDMEITENLTTPVYFYYELRNYYQNHRRYINSFSPPQLRANGLERPDSDCAPLDGVNDTSYFPCGLVANSFFNDSFILYDSSDPSTVVSFSQENIAWATDRDVRFRNPPPEDNPEQPSDETLAEYLLLPNWPRMIDNAQRNESFMVWMRPAAFPIFRKLYAKLNSTSDQLPAGNYTLRVLYNYPVSNFDGAKSFVIAEVSTLGSRNLFIGSAYITTGGISILAGLALILMRLFISKWKLSNPNYNKRKW